MSPFFIPGMGIISFIFVIVALVIGILWSILPFAIFGTKSRLDLIIKQLEKANENIEMISNQIKHINFIETENKEIVKNKENYDRFKPS